MPTTFKLGISLGNAAFEDEPGELARILRRLAARFEDSPPQALDARPVLDTNGNEVGGWTIELADDEDEPDDEDEQCDDCTDTIHYGAAVIVRGGGPKATNGTWCVPCARVRGVDVAHMLGD